MRFIQSLILLFISFSSYAQSRWIDLSWEKVDQAKSYEIELYEFINKDQSNLFEKTKTIEPVWSKQVPPGKYQFRLRALDGRDVPGEWSELSLIDVRLPRPIYVYPLPNDLLKGLEQDEENIHFEWKAVEGASFYVFEVWKSEGFHFRKIVHGNSITHRLPVAQKYFWRVLPMISESDEIPPPGSEGGASFFLQGRELVAPKVSVEKKNDFLSISWGKILQEESYEIEIFWLSKNDKWTKYAQQYNFNGNELKYPVRDLEGQYRFTIRALREGYKESPYTFVEFSVDVSKNVSVSKLRTQSTSDLKNTNPFFYSLGFEYLTIQYVGTSNEKDTQLSTGLSGQKFIAEFAYQDFYSLWKHRLNAELMTASKLGESRRLFEVDYLLGQVKKWDHSYIEMFGGLFYRDNLFIEADRFNEELNFASIPTLGPMISIRPMYVLNRRFDLGLDLKGYYNSYATQTPSGEGLKPTFSYKARLALTFHYKEETTWTLFSGFYKDSISYGAGTDKDSIATPGSINQSNSSGKSIGLLINSFF